MPLCNEIVLHSKVDEAQTTPTRVEKVIKDLETKLVDYDSDGFNTFRTNLTHLSLNLRWFPEIFGTKLAIKPAKNNLIFAGNLISNDPEKLSHFINQNDDDFYYDHKRQKLTIGEDKVFCLITLVSDKFRPIANHDKVLINDSVFLSRKTSSIDTPTRFYFYSHTCNTVFFPYENYLKISTVKNKSFQLIFNKETERFYFKTSKGLRYNIQNSQNITSAYTGIILPEKTLTYFQAQCKKHPFVNFILSPVLKKEKESSIYLSTFNNLHNYYNKQLAKDLQIPIFSSARKQNYRLSKYGTKAASNSFFGVKNKYIINIIKAGYLNVTSFDRLKRFEEEVLSILRESDIDENILALCTKNEGLCKAVVFILLNQKHSISYKKFSGLYKDFIAPTTDVSFTSSVFLDTVRMVKELLEMNHPEIETILYEDFNAKQQHLEAYRQRRNNNSLHDRIMDIYNNVSSLIKDALPLYLEDDKAPTELTEKIGDFDFTVPLTPKELKNIGKDLNICVGSYSNSVKTKRCRIVEFRDNGVTTGCIEIVNNSIVQAKLKHNSRFNTNEQYLDVILQYAKNKKLDVKTRDVNT